MLLRAVRETDLPSFFEFQREPESVAMVPMPARDEEEFYRHWREKILAKPEVIIRAVEVDGRVAGHVCIFIRNGYRQLGYWLGKEFWGRGVATKAVQEFLSHHDKSRPLFAVHAVSNLAFSRILQKCGFELAGDFIKEPDGVPRLLVKLSSPVQPLGE